MPNTRATIIPLAPGFRSIILFNIKEVLQVGAEVLGLVSDAIVLHEEVRAALALHFDKLVPVMTPRCIRHVTAGPGDVLVVPCGWLCLERTSDRAVFGLRRVLQFRGASALKEAEDLNSHRKEPSAVLSAIAVLLQAARASQGAGGETKEKDDKDKEAGADMEAGADTKEKGQDIGEEAKKDAEGLNGSATNAGEEKMRRRPRVECGGGLTRCGFETAGSSRQQAHHTAGSAPARATVQ